MFFSFVCCDSDYYRFNIQLTCSISALQGKSATLNLSPVDRNTSPNAQNGLSVCLIVRLFLTTENSEQVECFR